jgi:transketolase
MPTAAPSSPRGRNVSLAMRAYNIRRNALRMAEVQGQGYIAQALGIADVLAVAYFHAMNYRPDDIAWEGRDRFLLSTGHYAIALYAALIEAEILPEDELETYGSDDSRLPMSGMAAYTPGMEITGGSLGQGLPIAVGMALALRHKRSQSFVYTLFSDGEANEGSTWEAALSAGSFGLGNLIGIVDVNNMQADGPSAEVLRLEPLQPKFEAFGWEAVRVDGNDLDALVAAFDRVRRSGSGRPKVLICDTRMAKGVPFLEERERSHFLRVEPEEWARAFAALEAEKPA